MYTVQYANGAAADFFESERGARNCLTGPNPDGVFGEWKRSDFGKLRLLFWRNKSDAENDPGAAYAEIDCDDDADDE